MTFLSCRFMIFCSVMLSIAGCQNSKSEPSYADLVVIYNAEVEALDRLQKKHDELLEKLELLTQPSKADKAADMLKGFLETAGDLKRKHKDRLPEDPNELLDLALENTDKAEVIASQVIDAVSTPSEEEASARQEELISLRVKLAELDKEIAEQEKRVERARKNRDVAELRQ